MNENLVVSPESGNFPKMNVFQRVFGVIFYPGKLMEELERKPRVLLGIILSVITPIAMMFAAFPMFKEYLRTTMETAIANSSSASSAQMTPEMFEQVLNASAISTPVLGGLGAGVMLIVEALILWGVVKIFKGQGGFKQYLSILGYTAVISVLSSIAFVVTAQLTGTFTQISYTSLAALLPEMKGSFFYGAAKSLDVFSIWQFVVVAIGTATVSKLNKKKAYLIIACLFIILMVYTGVSEVRVAGLMK